MLFIFSAAVYLRVKVIDKSIEGKGVEVITQDPVEDLNQTEPVEDFEIQLGNGPGVQEYPTQEAQEHPEQGIQEDINQETQEDLTLENTSFCFDSDNGIYESVLGFLDTENSSELYDHCEDETTLVEYYCENETSNEYLVECVNGCLSGVCMCVNDIDCVSGFFCEEGECKPNCIDSDFGINYYVKGDVFARVNETNNYSAQDYCYNNTDLLKEQYCHYGNINQRSHNCTYGCENGTCISCEDSDGGRKYYVKGISSIGNNLTNDHCLNNNTLMETYCGVGGLLEEEYGCTNGCENGSCITCASISENEDIYAGLSTPESEITVRLWDNAAEDGDVVDVVFNDIFIDINYSLTNVGKTYNLILQEGINKFTAVDVETPEGRMSLPGGRVLTAAAEIIGIGGQLPSFRMDETGQRRSLIIYSNQNVTTETITGGDPLEMLCEIIALAEEETNQTEDENEEGVVCTDSDVDEGHLDGFNPEVFGYFSGTPLIIDYCMDSEYLNEFFCDEEGHIDYHDEVFCPNGCENGKCLPVE